jgi:arylsulfatase A-like enzyme
MEPTITGGPNGLEKTGQTVRYTQPADKPNVLLIVIDAFRAAHMSALGYERPTTPNLDRLASEGVLFEQAISPGSWSLPSHASLFTGLYVSKHGAHDEHKYLSELPDNITLAQRLKAAGLDRGFEIFKRHRPQGLGDKLKFYTSKGWARLTGTRDNGARWASIRARDLLRAALREEKPFFIFLQYLEPHAPYHIPRAWQHKFLPRHIPYKEAIKVNQDPNAFIAGAVKMSDQDFAILRDLYDTEIAYLDSQIGKLIAYLDAKGLRENTLVVITSDHGENLGDHGLMAHKFCLYETLIHVPLLLRMPGTLAEQQRVRYQVQTHDIVPTIYDLAGLKIEPHIQAKSLLRPESKRMFTIAERMIQNLSTFEQKYPGCDTSPLKRRLKAIRTDRYKYIWASDGRAELYDLQTDPHETLNLIHDLPEIAADLETQLMDWSNSFEPAEISEADVPQMDERLTDRLRDLGYLE